MALKKPYHIANNLERDNGSLTPFILKQFEGFEDIGDIEAQDIVESLHTLAQILLKHTDGMDDVNEDKP
jgi:hypothetical protein